VLIGYFLLLALGIAKMFGLEPDDDGKIGSSRYSDEMKPEVFLFDRRRPGPRPKNVRNILLEKIEADRKYFLLGAQAQISRRLVVEKRFEDCEKCGRYCLSKFRILDRRDLVENDDAVFSSGFVSLEKFLDSEDPAFVEIDSVLQRRNLVS